MRKLIIQEGKLVVTIDKPEQTGVLDLSNVYVVNDELTVAFSNCSEYPVGSLVKVKKHIGQDFIFDGISYKLLTVNDVIGKIEKA